MPGLRPVKAKQLLRVLYGLGFYPVRQSGSHIILKHVDGRTAIVPFHANKDVSIGIIRKLLREIGVDPQEFIKLL